MQKNRDVRPVCTLFIVLMLTIGAVFGCAYRRQAEFSPQKTEAVVMKDTAAQNNVEEENIKDAFVFAWNMPQNQVEEVVVQEWNGERKESFSDLGAVNQSFAVNKVGILDEQSAKMFFEYDDAGLYYLEVFFTESNSEAVELLKKIFGEQFEEVANSLGEIYNVYLCPDGTAVVYDNGCRVIIYDALRENLWTKERNFEYKILVNDLTNAI